MHEAVMENEALVCKTIVRNTEWEFICVGIHTLENMVRGSEKIEKSERSNDYLQIFKDRGIKVGVVSRRGVKKKLARFMQRYKADWNEIQAALELYFVNRDPKYFHNADNVLFKGVGVGEISPLKDYLDEVRSKSKPAVFL